MGSLSGRGVGLDKGGQSPSTRRSSGVGRCGCTGIPGAAMLSLLSWRRTQVSGDWGDTALPRVHLPLLRDSHYLGLSLVSYSQDFHIGLYFNLKTCGTIFQSPCFSFPQRHCPGAQCFAQRLHRQFLIFNGTARTEVLLLHGELLCSRFNKATLLLGSFAFALPDLELQSHKAMAIMGQMRQKSAAQHLLLTDASLLVISNRADALLGRGKHGNALPFCLPYKSVKSRINQNALILNDLWCPFAGLAAALGAQLRFKPK